MQADMWQTASQCADLSCLEAQWTTAAACGTGSCVEARAWTGSVQIRDTKNREAGAVTVPAGQWNALLAGIRTGQLVTPQ